MCLEIKLPLAATFNLILNVAFIFALIAEEIKENPDLNANTVKF